jgi:hypothetical protein
MAVRGRAGARVGDIRALVRGASSEGNARPIPAILKTPIPTSPQLWAMLIKAPGEEITEAQRRAYQEYEKHFGARLATVYAHFGIDPHSPGSEDKLIIAMARELFPRGFRLQGGLTPTAGAPEKWTASDRLMLVRSLNGMANELGSLRKAAEKYAREHAMTAGAVEEQHRLSIKRLADWYADLLKACELIPDPQQRAARQADFKLQLERLRSRANLDRLGEK